VVWSVACLVAGNLRDPILQPIEHLIRNAAPCEQHLGLDFLQVLGLNLAGDRGIELAGGGVATARG
jgi:hypothetical protein